MLEKRLDRAEIDIIELESKVKEMEKKFISLMEKTNEMKKNQDELIETLNNTTDVMVTFNKRIKELEKKKCLWLEREGNCNGCEGKENKTCPLEEKLLIMHILPKGE